MDVPALVLQPLDLFGSQQDGHGRVKEADLTNELELVDLHVRHEPRVVKGPLVRGPPDEAGLAAAKATVEAEAAHVGARPTTQVLTPAIGSTVAVEVLSMIEASLIVIAKHDQRHGPSHEDKHGTTELCNSVE